ncbi:MAG: hypothetical protein AB7D51_08125 [Desulfovibrionaceae bacterium]
MLDNLFVSNSSGPSEYVQGLMTSLSVAEDMRNSFHATGLTLLDKAGGLAMLGPGNKVPGPESAYVAAIHKRHEVENLARNEKEEKTLESHERNLEETREDIDRAAEGETPGKPSTETVSETEGQQAEGATDNADAKNSTDSTTLTPAEELKEAAEADSEAGKQQEEDVLETLQRVREEKGAVKQFAAAQSYATTALTPVLDEDSALEVTV